MVVPQPSLIAQRSRLAQETRKRFVADASAAMQEIGGVVQQRLLTLMNEGGSSRDMQSRRDAWTLYRTVRASWIDGTLKDLQEALGPVSAKPKTPVDGTFELVGTDVAENQILVSRLVSGVMEHSSAELNDLHFRIRHLEGGQELESHDVLRPEILLLPIVERWIGVGMSREAWLMVSDAVQKLLTERIKLAYANGNAFLIKQGVLPTIELTDRVTRVAAARGVPAGARVPGPGPEAASMRLDADRNAELPGYGPAGRPGVGEIGGEREFLNRQERPGSQRSGGAFGGRLGWAGEAGPAETRPGQSGPAIPAPGHPATRRFSSDASSIAEETRMMTGTTPLARARGRAMGVVGQLKRMLIGAGGAGFEATAHQPPSPALAAAIAVRPGPGPVQGSRSRPGPWPSDADSVTVIEDYSPAGVARVSADLRRRTTDLKQKAETKNEKAMIEIVALMFQAILQEDRIPPAIRVWFARLQMPVLRVALMEPDFFGTLDHPARQLIDRMGSCVMGFDASGIHGSALENEIKRVVQVIEQYPETGRRVYQLVYDEFQKFLAQFLTGGASTQKVVGVAQQVEQKETLTIQYTIEMRNMLKDMPVRESIRQFLFKIWAEVLAVAAVRKGPQHAETLALKKLATDLIWAASAKPNRSDRARVIRDLPLILQKLRAGMNLLGVAASEQEAYIKTVSDALADAFVSKTQAIPNEQIAAMAERLAHLEDFVSDEGMGDLPLDAQSIEMMLGLDASNIDVVTDGGSKPTAAMQAWAQELLLGSWFTLDHNGQVTKVQFVWRSERKHLNLFASSDGRSFLIQARRLAAYLQAGLLLPQEQETLTVRATRDALVKLTANPERLLD